MSAADTVSGNVNGVWVVCVLFGVALGAVYIVFKVLKLTLGIKKIGEIFLDIIFWVITAFAMYLLSYAATEGRLRFIETALALIGFFSIYIVVDPIVNHISNRVNIILKWLSRLFKKCKKNFRRLLNLKIRSSRKKNPLKSQKFQKKT